jgi:hypothetical protein
MVDIRTAVEIGAPPAEVWSVLIDFAGMAAWNPFIRSIVGEAVAGSRLRVTIAPPGKTERTFEPSVLAAVPGRELRWLGTVLGGWMFSGEHYFQLAPAQPGATLFVHGERFSGILAPLIMRGQMLAATERGFALMNEALKKRCESSGRSPV